MALLRHRDEVQGSVEATRQLRKINIEAELVADEIEHLVVVRILHKVGTRPNVRRVRPLCDKLEIELIARSRDTVCSSIVTALNCTIRRACTVGRA